MPTPTGPPRPELQGWAVRELAIVHQLTSTRLNRALKPLGLTLTHVSLLTHLTYVPAGCSVGEIAEAMEVNQPAVSKTLRTLTDHGAVDVETSASDARRRVVRLTARGADLLSQARLAMHPEATHVFSVLPDDELTRLASLLAVVHGHLDHGTP
ncbi:MarR family winged helix-turn-helix transcriptional regulator [Cellulomonas sp. P5_C5]